jgi:hypothetical protein
VLLDGERSGVESLRARVESPSMLLLHLRYQHSVIVVQLLLCVDLAGFIRSVCPTLMDYETFMSGESRMVTDLASP